MKRNKTIEAPSPAPATDGMMTVFNMRISMDRYAVLRAIAAQEDRTIASLVRLLVEDGLRFRAQRSQQRPQRQIEPAPTDEPYPLPGSEA